MRKILLLLWGLLCLFGELLAQTRTITGTVKDEGGNPIPNVSVTVRGASAGTTTKQDGSFSITLPAAVKQLQISSVGYEQQNILIGSDNTLSIRLVNLANEISTVIVTGYTREKKSQFVGSASVLGSKVVETVPVGSFDQALQGRAPGLLINSGSGQPGTSAAITIRGIQSITGANAQPLFVIDGVPMPAGDFQTINPNDFESITVLKDAGAAALYGARGGLGVIVITTKKGKAGATNFTYRTQVGFTNPPSSTNFDMMNTQEILEYEERLKLANTPGWTYSKNNPTYATLSDATKARYDFILDSIGKINTNYADLLFRRGFSQTHELNMSGGNDKTRFFLSAGYFDQEGTDLSSQLKRYTTRFNLEHTANKVTVMFNTTAGYSITNYSEGEWLGNSARNSFQMAWRAKPYENPYKPDGTLNFGSNSTLALKQIANVLEGMENSSLRQNQIKINAGLTVAYKLLPFITLKNTLGVDVADDRWQRYINPASYVGSLQSFTAGLNNEANKTTSQIINTSSAVFSNRYDKHEVEAGAYFEVVRGYQKALGLLLYNLDPRLQETGTGAGLLPIGNATAYAQNATSAKSGFGIRSYFFTGRYTYDNKYTVTGNIRRDGTSRILNDANKEITTWSAGAIWNAIGEEFMRNQYLLTDLKVRASYGSVPNIGSISTANYTITGFPNGFLSVTNYLGPQMIAYTTNSYPGSTVTGQYPTSSGNPDLKIETIHKFNFGVDFAAWQSRARFTIDLYSNKTVDLFVNQLLWATTGFGNTFKPINAGTMTNQGIEFTANVDVVKTGDIDVTLGVNHAINKNKIVDLGGVDEYFAGTFLIREGLSYGSHYTYHYLGADPQTGRPRYEKLDGTETNDVGQAGQFAKFGTYLPKHAGGFTADFRYKGFTVSTLFSYQFDVVRSNNVESWIVRGTPGFHTALNASKRLLTQQWQKPGDEAYYQSSAYDRGFTSADLQDAKFLRFRSLNVAYQIPEIAFKGTKIIKSAKIYAQGRNLIIWSPWRGLDPEDNNNISLNEYPNPRAFVAGIDINF
jgi:TonB-linked SusC/RagA family outer membrane protein